MSQKTNPKIVGLFVLGAFAIGIAGLLLFGGASLFTKSQTFVLFFRGSVAGLQVGAPVNFRGVPLGQVTDISVSYFPRDDDSDFVIPVYVRVEPSRIRGVQNEDQRTPEELVALGLRAELALQSFVTGQLGIELDFRPGTEVILAGLDPATPEVPTLTSDTEKLRASITRVADILENVPLEDIAEDIHEAVQAASGSIIRVSDAIDAVAERIGPIADEIFATVSEAHDRLEMEPGEILFLARQNLVEIQQLVETLQTTLGPLSDDARRVISTIGMTTESTGALVEAIESQLPQIVAGLSETMAAATATMDEFRNVAQSLDARAGPLLTEAETALRTATEVLDAARAPLGSVGRLADRLETEVAPAASAFTDAMLEARVALDNGALAISDLRGLIATVNDGVAPMIARADGILGQADLAMRDARSAVAGVSGLVSPDAATVSQLNAALREIRRAAVSLREFADFVARNPNALLTGRR